MSYTNLDNQLIALFESHSWVSIRELLRGEFPEAGVVPTLFNPLTEGIWTSPVGVYQTDSYNPYEGQEARFYRAISLTQKSWGSNIFEVALSLRAPNQVASKWSVDTGGLNWVFSIEVEKEELIPFLQSL